MLRRGRRVLEATGPWCAHQSSLHLLLKGSREPRYHHMEGLGMDIQQAYRLDRTN